MPEVECVLSEEAYSLGQIVKSSKTEAAMSVAFFFMLHAAMCCTSHVGHFVLDGGQI